jgi:hypothetical protein
MAAVEFGAAAELQFVRRFICAMDRPERCAMSSISAAVSKGKGTSALGLGLGAARLGQFAAVSTKPPPME